MSKKLHIVPKEPVAVGQKWNAHTGHLVLSKAGTFDVLIIEMEGFLDNPKHPKPEPFEKLSKEDFQKLSFIKKSVYERELKIYEEKQMYYEHSLQKIRESVCWCWEKVGKGMEGRKISHNNSFSKGLPFDLRKQIKFPKILEGGAPAWLEVFTENDPATGQLPHGIFVSATGTPKVIAAEWRDYAGKLITEEIAFGSTVYLHIYTEALYGQNIKVQLADDGVITDTNLTPTPSDKDGNPVQRLDPNALTTFSRSVNTHQWNKITQPPDGTITNSMVIDKSKEQLSVTSVQKCVFPVFIEQAWQFQAKGNFDSGKSLNIKPIVYHDKIKNQKIDLDDCVLKVSRNGILMQGELKGNNPLVLGEADKTGAPEEKKKIDFTFGVFIDGTLNNMYNTIARRTWEEDQIKKKHSKLSYEEQQKQIENPEEHLKVAASSQDQIGKEKESKYKYSDDNSFENDLSNPAIIFKNYLDDSTNKSHPVFKIYTEGMGTNTLNDDEKKADTGILPLENYEQDDIMEGPGFGQGKAGILDRVERAVKLMADKIIEIGETEVGTITVDVFGFSRGAASARAFVHEITRQSYMATGTNYKGERYYKDANGHEVSSKYSDKKLPSNGRLGYHLTETKNPITFDRLIIRFAGLYDTVPHHGFVQWNDVKDLGLNSISKAKFTVHMVAADEHRANFDLVDISCITGKKGGGKTDRGVELYLPGVHCDVGGSYVEGRSEVNGRLLVTQSMFGDELEKEKEHLITEGWFKPKELTIHWDNAQRTIINGVARVLSSKRGSISNQYSYIPLHLMVNFCLDKGVIIKEKSLKEIYNFKNTKFSNADFLEKIKTRLEDYAFRDGQPFVYEIVPMRTIIYSTDDHTAVVKEEEKRKNEEDSYNAVLKKLRHEYLHWNAVYGEGVVNTLVQPNKPNFEDGKRKRNING
ncbi:T6SS phospholipase effector Tle1-like catalytic domain-containing protein [Flavobacterium daemonense]|uniref:T6SS phospholipase effector Tle1-like catalytic domain-containing protein n=1 Tax=Flavobacterium daemonense TaxID=1393049 RepID=UPI001185915D|nr:DUF2235 domain-containing protein [Flavobacterium daemonense]KAF2336912.1 DUF2235 domain-containing protein [Flavobacterium daemonense]